MSISDEDQIQEQQVQHSLRPGPFLPGHTVQRDEKRLTWMIDQTLIPCTPPEYACLKVLLEQANRRVLFAQLAGYLPEITAAEDAEQKMERVRMRHLMSNLRNKIWMLGIDIVSLRGVGYMLLLDMQDGVRENHEEHVS